MTLAEAIKQRRGLESGRSVARSLGVSAAMISRLEHGLHRPSYDTAVKLAVWLGWSTDQVMKAAGEPAP